MLFWNSLFLGRLLSINASSDEDRAPLRVTTDSLVLCGDVLTPTLLMEIKEVLFNLAIEGEDDDFFMKAGRLLSSFSSS